MSLIRWATQDSTSSLDVRIVFIELFLENEPRSTLCGIVLVEIAVRVGAHRGRQRMLGTVSRSCEHFGVGGRGRIRGRGVCRVLRFLENWIDTIVIVM